MFVEHSLVNYTRINAWCGYIFYVSWSCPVTTDGILYSIQINLEFILSEEAFDSENKYRGYKSHQKNIKIKLTVIDDYDDRHCTRSSATAEIARDAWNGCSRSFKVICCCANRRGTYDFIFYYPIVTIFNRSWDITPSLHINIHFFSRWNWKKTAGSRWVRFDVRVLRTLHYPTIS